MLLLENLVPCDFDGISTRGPLFAASVGAEAKPEDVEDSPAVMRLVCSGSISKTLICFSGIWFNTVLLRITLSGVEINANESTLARCRRKTKGDKPNQISLTVEGGLGMYV